MLTQNNMKKLSAEYALKYVKDNMIVGVGTGTTVNFFIEALKNSNIKIEGAVASSEDTRNKLKLSGIPILDLNFVGNLDIYVDGADEVNKYKQMIKGGGAALTREKVLACCSQKFVCIVDESKFVDILGAFPLPIEVIPMARSYVAREIVKIGGVPNWRQNIITDNQNVILDIYNFVIDKPLEIEEKINNIAGVVSNGIFAKRTADVLLVGCNNGDVKIY
jgi:ribose 5-phosphate isomerase A